jgi:hypothetical protein
MNISLLQLIFATGFRAATRGPAPPRCRSLARDPNRRAFIGWLATQASPQRRTNPRRSPGPGQRSLSEIGLSARVSRDEMAADQRRALPRPTLGPDGSCRVSTGFGADADCVRAIKPAINATRKIPSPYPVCVVGPRLISAVLAAYMSP